MIDKPHIKEALKEAMKIFPEAVCGLIWFISASGILADYPTSEHKEWAENIIKNLNEEK